MTQEEKDLLLKDLCARLPYGVICQMEDKLIINDSPFYDYTLSERHIDLFRNHKDFYIKPYLRPMSSMTEDECITLSKLIPYETDAWKYIKTPVPLYIVNTEQFDFFHSHHLDWRGLISKGLAIEVTEVNNPYKE